MQYIDGIENYRDTQKSVVTFGKFDGLHKGHQKLINKVQELAEMNNLKSIVCYFDMNRKNTLMTKEDRQFHLEGQVDYLVRGVFTDAFRRMSAEDFIRVIVKDRFNADYVVVGADFHFGYGKMGDRRMLNYYSDRYEYKPIILYKECYGEHSISSTYVKDNIRRGNVRLANVMLGYNFGITGVIKPGTQQGRMLECPTFNLDWPENKIMPPNGVYFTRTLIDGIWYNGVSNIGTKPTISDESEVIVKTHLFGYSGNAYGKTVRLEILQFHREEIKFPDVKDLRECVTYDILYAKKYFGTTV